MNSPTIQSELPLAAAAINPPELKPAPSPAADVAQLVYTSDQVCAALQISKVSLWRLEKRGLLTPLAHLRHKRYPIAGVQKLASGGAAKRA